MNFHFHNIITYFHAVAVGRLLEDANTASQHKYYFFVAKGKQNSLSRLLAIIKLTRAFWRVQPEIRF